MLTRRGFLQGAAALAVSGACRSGRSGRSADPPPSAPPPTGSIPPESRPTTTLPEGADTLPQIEHIVVVMMENHSFDNYFGMLGRGDGFSRGPDGRPTNTVANGRSGSLRAFEMPTPCQLPTKP